MERLVSSAIYDNGEESREDASIPTAAFLRYIPFRVRPFDQTANSAGMPLRLLQHDQSASTYNGKKFVAGLQSECVSGLSWNHNLVL